MNESRCLPPIPALSQLTFPVCLHQWALRCWEECTSDHSYQSPLIGSQKPVDGENSLWDHRIQLPWHPIAPHVLRSLCVCVCVCVCACEISEIMHIKHLAEWPAHSKQTTNALLLLSSLWSVESREPESGERNWEVSIWSTLQDCPAVDRSQD